MAEQPQCGSMRPAQNLKPATYRCPFCGKHLASMSEHVLIARRTTGQSGATPTWSAYRRHARRGSCRRVASGSRRSAGRGRALASACDECSPGRGRSDEADPDPPPHRPVHTRPRRRRRRLGGAAANPVLGAKSFAAPYAKGSGPRNRARSSTAATQAARSPRSTGAAGAIRPRSATASTRSSSRAAATTQAGEDRAPRTSLGKCGKQRA